MSKYTTEVRFICETASGLNESVGSSSVDNVIKKARTKIFDFDYPIFDSKYKSVLECKILKHFYTREICAETVGLWKIWLNSRMNDIMPYYNKLYEAELLKFNPLYDVDITTDHNTKQVGDRKEDSIKNQNIVGDVNSDRTGQGSNDMWNYYSDTPQGTVGNLADLTYLTNATHETNNNNVHENNKTNSKTKDDTSNKVNSNFNTTEDYLEHVKGKRGGVTYSKMLLEYRDTFINIDLMIMNELNDLFFNLW